MRMNRRELPNELTSKRCEVGSIFEFSADSTLVFYAPKKNKRVVSLSSKHMQPEIDESSGKPDIILTYNRGKGGVDNLDQMRSAGTSRKKTRRWPKCVF